VWIRSRVDPAAGFFMDTGTAIFMIGWLVICGLGWMGPIANAAHFSGLGIGCAIGALPLVGRRLRRR
jgi:GlpG protein